MQFSLILELGLSATLRSMLLVYPIRMLHKTMLLKCFREEVIRVFRVTQFFFFFFPAHRLICNERVVGICACRLSMSGLELQLLLTTLIFPLQDVYLWCGVCFLESFTVEVLYCQVGFSHSDTIYISSIRFYNLKCLPLCRSTERLIYCAKTVFSYTSNLYWMPFSSWTSAGTPGYLEKGKEKEQMTKSR